MEKASSNENAEVASIEKQKRAESDETSSDGKASKEKKSNSSKKTESSSIPKKRQMSVLDKLVYSIRSLNDGPVGSSRQAIRTFLKAEFNLDYNFYVKKAFKNGVKDGILVQSGQRFRVATDSYENFEVKMDATVQMNDLKVGQGEQLTQHGDVVTIRYVGTLEDGTEFDRAKSFTFLLGAGEVIKGMDKGVMNMRVGGKRKMIIPSKLGYGRRGSPPEVPPNATLHFEITLLACERL